MLDEGEIRQLLLNLARNALDAMPPNKGTIQTYREGEEVVLAVRDQGQGIHPDILREIGKLVTTKRRHWWVWQFVSICYRHNAVIEVESSQAAVLFM